MNSTLVALGAIVIVVLVSCVVTAAPSERSRRRVHDRRARYVAHHPGAAKRADVWRRLGEVLTDEQVAFVAAKVDDDWVPSPVLWRWLDRFDAATLVLALASGRGGVGLHRLLETSGPIDLAELTLLARLSEPELFDLAAA